MDYTNEKAAELAAQAKEKLEKERKDVKGQKEMEMADAVMAALVSFAGQDAEFADAIVTSSKTSSKTFENCMKDVAKGVGRSISDLDAYKRAARFYFPGSGIEMQMTIHTNPYEKPTDPKEATIGKVMTLSLEDIL